MLDMVAIILHKKSMYRKHKGNILNIKNGFKKIWFCSGDLIGFPSFLFSEMSSIYTLP